MQFWESLGQQWGVLKQKLPVGGVPREVDSPRFRVFVVLSHWLETGFGKFGLGVNTVVEKTVHSCRLSVTYAPWKFSWKKMATGRKQKGSTSLAATLPVLIQLISPKGSQEIAAPLPRVTQTLLEGSPLGIGRGDHFLGGRIWGPGSAQFSQNIPTFTKSALGCLSHYVGWGPFWNIDVIISSHQRAHFSLSQSKFDGTMTPALEENIGRYHFCLLQMGILRLREAEVMA